MTAAPGEYILVNPVWGDEYVERFVKLSLPAQLSAGNIPAMPADRTRYVICTHECHFAAIRQSASFQRLDDRIPVEFEALDELPDPRFIPSPFELMTAAYSRAIRSGREPNAAFLFLTPDLLLSDGSLRRVVDLCERDRKRVVMISSVRMTVDGAMACVDTHRTGRHGEVCIPPRDLVRHCLESLHPISLGHVVGDGGVRAANHFYFPAGRSGLLIHAFHQHPLFVWPSNPDANIRNSVDDDYVARACPNSSDRYVVTDSDEICVTEFSKVKHGSCMVADEVMTEEQLLAFMTHMTNPAHRELVGMPHQFHAEPVDDAEWQPVRSEAGRFLSRLFERFYAPKVAPRPSRSRMWLANMLPAGMNPLAAPLRLVYRLLGYPLYRYLDRLNAEILDARNEIASIRVMQARMADRLMQMTTEQPERNRNRDEVEAPRRERVIRSR